MAIFSGICKEIVDIFIVFCNRRNEIEIPSPVKTGSHLMNHTKGFEKFPCSSRFLWTIKVLDNIFFPAHESGWLL